MDISQNDRDILRGLGSKVAEIAALLVQKEKINMWKRLNNLQSAKPMIWIWSKETPWHEMNVNGELTLQTTNELCRQVEWELRMSLYMWEHMRGDMVIEPVVFSPLVIKDTGFGIRENVDISKTDENNSVVSRHFNIQIKDEEDLEKIKTPVVTHDCEASENNYQTLQYIFNGILNVEKRGAPGFWFAPWDELVRWCGVQEVLLDLYERPELVHKAMERLTNAYLCRLDQYEKQKLLSLNNTHVRIGSGGIGYTDELPQSDYDPAHIKAKDLWGSGAAQIFGEVSPKMHEEFALQYEIKWLERFGLNYYGCCEPLHRKIGILKKIPNLRKISMSRWINIEEAVENMGGKYVFSYKPNPAVFAFDNWDSDAARAELVNVLEKAKAKGCQVEIIMKDISTVRYQPQRLWEWARIAEEVAEKYSG